MLSIRNVVLGGDAVAPAHMIGSMQKHYQKFCCYKRVLRPLSVKDGDQTIQIALNALWFQNTPFRTLCF